LQQQLQAVQAQLKQLALRIRRCCSHQQQIEQQLSQQRQQLAAQPVAPATPAVPASSALPASSPLPDQSAAASALPAAPGTSGSSAASLPGAQPNGFGAGPLSNLRLWGYGEIYYTRPTRDAARTQAILRGPYLASGTTLTTGRSSTPNTK